MNRILSVTLMSGVGLCLSGCDLIQPKLEVDVTAVLPCNQGNALAGVGLMQVRSEADDGSSSAVSAKLSAGSADLTGMAISDGTTIFMNGFAGEGADALQGVAVASGATVPLDLEAHVQGSRLPPANRQYGSAGVLIGKVNGFGRTTSIADKSCTQLAQARHGHTATYSRATRKVVIIGGLTYAASDGAEAFVPRARALEYHDPNTGTFEAVSVAGSVGPVLERAYHTATELPNGNILVVGGIGPEGENVTPRALSFIFNPATKEAVVLGAQQGFQLPRWHHTATLAGNNVIIAGGCGCTGGLTAAQLKAGDCPSISEQCTQGTPRVAAVDRFDVADRRIQTITTAVMANPRAFHTATLLSGGLLVIAGGHNGQNAVGPIELLRTAPEVQFIPGSSDSLMSSAVTHAAAVLLPSRDCSNLLADHPEGSECVLITGGCTQVPANGACATVQATSTIWDFGRAAGSRIQTGPAAFRKHWGHRAFHLPEGSNMVVVAGGFFEVQGGETAVSAELLPRRTSMGAGVTPFAPAPPPFMFEASARNAVAILPAGQILFTGGVESVATGTQRASLSSAEYFFHPLK